MGDIYSGCSICFCYLGEDEEYTSLALAYAKSRVAYDSFPHAELVLDENGDLDRHKSGDGVEFLPVSAADDDDGARAFFRLCRNPYFKRGWIVQEVILSSTAVGLCGKHIFSLKAIVHTLVMDSRNDSRRQGHTASDLKRLSVALPGGNEGLNHNAVFHLFMIDLKRNADRECSLFDMVCRIRYLLVGDPRDKIYAALSLAKDRHAYPAAGYELNVEGVYCAYAEAFVVAGRGLDVIQHAGDTDGVSRFSLPSWVPDWSVRHEINTLSLSSSRLGHSSVAQDSVTLGAIPGTIMVDARCMCLLKEIVDHRRPSRHDVVEPLWDSLLAMQQFVLRVGPPELNVANVWPHLWFLIRQGIAVSEELFSAKHEETFARMAFYALKNRTDSPFNITDNTRSGAFNNNPKSASHVVANQVVKMVEHNMECYTLALTTTGEIAVVPFRSLAGDQIVHFKNALALYTLRLNPGSNTYRPIGGAYIESWGKDMSNEPDWETVTPA